MLGVVSPVECNREDKLAEKCSFLVERYRGHCWVSRSNLVERWGNLEVEEKETTNCITVKRKEIHK